MWLRCERTVWACHAWMRNHVFASREKSLATLSIVPHTLSVERFAVRNTRKKINKKKNKSELCGTENFPLLNNFIIIYSLFMLTIIINIFEKPVNVALCVPWSITFATNAQTLIRTGGALLRVHNHITQIYSICGSRTLFHTRPS